MMTSRVVGTRIALWSHAWGFSSGATFTVDLSFDKHQWWVGLQWVETRHGYRVHVELLPCLPLSFMYDDGVLF